MNLDALLKKFDLLVNTPEAVSKVREIVLQLGVTGRLVPQDPRDESAEALLISTRAQRASLVAKKIIKRRHSRSIPPSEAPFVPPHGWTWATLSDVGHELGQKVPDKRFTYIDVGAIDAHQGRISKRVEQLEPNRAPSRARKIVTRGTVIYSTVRPYLRNIAIVSSNYDPEPIASTAFGILHPFDGIDNRYLFYWLRSGTFTSYARAKMKGQAYPAINDQKFYGGYIALPPYPEQQRIVAKLDELMAVCDQLEEQHCERSRKHAILTTVAVARFNDAPTAANLEYLFHKSFAVPSTDLRTAILTLAVQGKLATQVSGDEPASLLVQRLAAHAPKEWSRGRSKKADAIDLSAVPYRLPKSWTWARFADVAEIASNLVSPKDFPTMLHLAPDNVEKGTGVLLPLVTVFEAKVISPKHRFLPGQIVYSKIRPNLAKAVLVDFEGLCSADMYPINAWIDSRYLHAYMLSVPFLTQAVKTDTRVAMPKINQTELNAIAVPVPPLAEQERIVRRVHELLSMVERLQEGESKSHASAAHVMDVVVAALVGETVAEEQRMKTPRNELLSYLRAGKRPAKNDHAPLAALLHASTGHVPAKALWQQSELDIGAFYQQLRAEINAGWIVPPEPAVMREVESH